MKIHFSGCSITAGEGFDLGKNDTRLYPNLVGQALNAEVINDALGGSSNLKIFTTAAKAMIDNPADVYVIQWSAVHRFWLYPRPDRGIYLSVNKPDPAYRDFIVQFQMLNHDYPNLMAVIDYSRILDTMATSAGSKIVFVNGMLPWTEDLLKRENPSDYNKLLFKGFTDDERAYYWHHLANNLELVDWTKWTNPWKNMTPDMHIDNAPLDDHPGPKTHNSIAELVLEKIKC